MIADMTIGPAILRSASNSEPSIGIVSPESDPVEIEAASLLPAYRIVTGEIPVVIHLDARARRLA
jgi:hypothetical protein